MHNIRIGRLLCISGVATGGFTRRESLITLVLMGRGLIPFGEDMDHAIISPRSLGRDVELHAVPPTQLLINPLVRWIPYLGKGRDSEITLSCLQGGNLQPAFSLLVHREPWLHTCDSALGLFKACSQRCNGAIGDLKVLSHQL